ncbi:Flp pilus assembly complex ATPase component TadA [Paenibacillus sp. MWE-103]|uniref:Flp pilus assembly complex ATPase component TadA n=1 Tax=Paenibacillus artemisiicola TaxID=1172618 RepID=A0ABS3WBZ7_9BACL|nr:ATPase, T2SS/T4P/T4SS family [Paenibacillus artemisiicola]MBO7745814.1 Flp pilus assembly complex ATPase component TadA [Paenibacillus artemisiicola]
MIRVSTLPPRPQRINFSIVEHLQKEKEDKRKTASIRGYQHRTLEEVVKIVQDQLKKTDGTAEEQDEHKEMIHQAGLGNPIAQERVKSIIKQIIYDHMLYASLGELQERMSLPEAVFALTVGAGYIEDLYKGKEIEEVQVNGIDIYIMRDGVSVKFPRVFNNMDQVIRLQERLALYGRARINEQHPICHTYMFNKARLTMTQSPYSAFPTIAIRNFILRDPELHSTLVDRGTLNTAMAMLLSLFVKYHASIIVAGGTKTGKTTTLYALAKEIPVLERVLSLETEMEMRLDERLPGRNIVPYQAVPELGISMEDAFLPLLRLSPDRIIIGEVRGPEASQAVQAALRGHDTMVSLHSKYRSMIITDIMDMVKQDGRTHDDNLLKNRIGRAFNIVIYQRFVKVNERKNLRVMTEITEVVPTENGDIIMRPLYEWKAEKNDWVRTEHKISHELMEHMMSYGASAEEFTALGLYGCN